VGIPDVNCRKHEGEECHCRVIIVNLETTGNVLKDDFSCNQGPLIRRQIDLSDLEAAFGSSSENSKPELPDGLILAEANKIKCLMACYELKDHTSTAPIEQTG
jgi:hypothetical protein